MIGFFEEQKNDLIFKFSFICKLTKQNSHHPPPPTKKRKKEKKAEECEVKGMKYVPIKTKRTSEKRKKTERVFMIYR